MAPPENVTELRRFCGMTNYFSLAKYMPNHVTTMEPLHQLTRSETAWQWTHEHQTAFKHVKEALTSSPTLAYFDSKRAVKLQCDASQFGLGAALLQDDRPVAYASRSLTTTEHYAQIEKELLAVVFGMEKLDVYTYGRFVEIESDHKPLQSIMKKPLVEAPKRLQRMLLRLQRYLFDLQYKRGTRPRNQNSNEIETICAVEESQFDDQMLERLKVETAQDKTLTIVAQLVSQGWPAERRETAIEAYPYFGH